MLDGVETDTGAFVSSSDAGTDPFNPDTDGDGLGDAIETGTGLFASPAETDAPVHFQPREFTSHPAIRKTEAGIPSSALAR